MRSASACRGDAALPSARTWPQDRKEAAVVHLHELHIEIPGVLVRLVWLLVFCWFFFRMQRKCAIPKIL